MIVDVEVEAGRRAELAAAVPQGINPQIKLLYIHLTPPERPAGGATTRLTLRYEEVPAASDYQKVWLGEGDAAIATKVSLVL